VDTDEMLEHQTVVVVVAAAVMTDLHQARCCQCGRPRDDSQDLSKAAYQATTGGLAAAVAAVGGGGLGERQDLGEVVGPVGKRRDVDNPYV
jgi:hypothetical protein